jgi:hypothetical protein
MKIRIKIATVLVLLVFFSCSKDDPGEISEIGADLVGTWILNEHHFEGNRRTIVNDQVDMQTFSATAWEISFSVVFSESPNNYSAVGIYNLDHTYTDENGQVYLFGQTLNTNDSGSWVKTGTSIRITIDDTIKQATISELSETTLKYVINSTRIETDEIGNVITIYRTDFFTFHRGSSSN